MFAGGSDLAGMLCERGVNTLLWFGVPESVAGWKGRYEAVQPLWPWQTLSVGGDGGELYGTFVGVAAGPPVEPDDGCHCLALTGVVDGPEDWVGVGGGGVCGFAVAVWG